MTILEYYSKTPEVLEKLTEIYNKWGDKHNLSPLGSADEEILREGITQFQYNFLNEFIDIWEKAQDVEDYINDKNNRY
jgi:hypothetical protein